MQATCPQLTTRWLVMGKVCKWLLTKRIALFEYINSATEPISTAPPKLVVGSYRWHQYIDGNNQPSIHQTSSTKQPHFYAISIIGDPFVGYLYDD